MAYRWKKRYRALYWAGPTPHWFSFTYSTSYAAFYADNRSEYLWETQLLRRLMPGYNERSH